MSDIGHKRRHADASLLVQRAAYRGVALDVGTARRLASSYPTAAKKVDDVCRIVRCGSSDGMALGFADALDRLDACGGNVNEALRRLLRSPVEQRPGVHELLEYAADRGIDFQPRTIYERLRRTGPARTKEYVDAVAAVMDTACQLRLDYPQSRAVRLLGRTGGSAPEAIAQLHALRRRNDDRLSAPCTLVAPPRDDKARTRVLAGCGCKKCSDLLADHLQPYIAKMLANPYFGNLDREEAGAIANHELAEAIAAWPGGENFAGYFSARLTTRVRRMYAAQPQEERDMLSLDAAWPQFGDSDRRLITPGERIPDRTVDVAWIVELRDRLERLLLEQRELWEQRMLEYLRSQAVRRRRPRTT